MSLESRITAVLQAIGADIKALWSAVSAAGGGGAGTAVVDFGAWPGSDVASVAVTGLTAIPAGARPRVWVAGTATADHSADEHLLCELGLQATDVVAGTGFTIRARAPRSDAPAKGTACRGLTGTFNVNWSY